MRFGSLFAGIGGFDLGLERAGMQCAWQVENNADCNRVLSNHWPNVERLRDVSTVGRLSRVSVLCGGFPCQDLSVAGKRAGLAGERSGLWFEFLRIICANLPRYVLIENVQGLLNSNEGRDFAVILRGLVECGYCLAWRILDAQFYGVAQRRRRVFIVGSLGDGSCAEILFESESVSWNPPTRREAGARVAPTIESGANRTGGTRPPGSTVDTAESLIAATLDQRGRGPTDAVMMNLQIANSVFQDSEYGCQEYDSAGSLRAGRIPEHQMVVTHALRSEGADAGEDGTGRGTSLVVAEAVDVRNLRMQPDGTSGTLQHKKSSAAAGQFGVRRLTPRECERLQSFPDDWTRYDASGKEISDSARYRMLGNAVCVNVAEWIGQRIIEAETKSQ